MDSSPTGFADLWPDRGAWRWVPSGPAAGAPTDGAASTAPPSRVKSQHGCPQNPFPFTFRVSVCGATCDLRQRLAGSSQCFPVVAARFSLPRPCLPDSITPLFSLSWISFAPLFYAPYTIAALAVAPTSGRLRIAWRDRRNVSHLALNILLCDLSRALSPAVQATVSHASSRGKAWLLCRLNGMLQAWVAFSAAFAP